MKRASGPFENILSESLAKVLIGAMRPGRLFCVFRDLWTWGLILAGGIGLLWSPNGQAPSFGYLLFAALVEETTFRALLQNYAEAWWAERRASPSGWLWKILTPGNLAVSVLFALCHAFTQSPLMAALTFFPSIGIGILWSRHRSLWLCFAVHAWYNMLFWY